MAWPPTGADGEGERQEPSTPAPDRRIDVEIVHRIAGGDRDAFRGLFRRHAAQANALALRVLRQPFLAEEAVQDAFLAVWSSAAAYDPRRGSVRAWLMGMVHNRAVDLVRREESQRRRAEATVAVVEPTVEDPAEDVVRAVGSRQEGMRVRSALAELPMDQRRVIELMYFDGLSQSRIAERLSLPLGTVKSRTLLGMRRLRDRLVEMER